MQIRGLIFGQSLSILAGLSDEDTSLVRCLFLALLIVGMLAPSAGWTAGSETSLKASSNWLVDWSEQSCAISRKFGTDHPVLLTMRLYEPGYAFQVSMAGDPVWRFEKAPNLKVIYGDGAPLQASGLQVGRMDGIGHAIIFERDVAFAEEKAAGQASATARPTPYPDQVLEARLDRIAIGTSNARLVLQTGPMIKAMAALRQCTDDLVRKWGLEPAIQAGLTRRAFPVNQAVWASSIINAFPPAGMQGSGRVHVRVFVNKKGMPTGCGVHHTFDNTKFLDSACEIIIGKARFQPALDKNGEPVDSYYSTAIFFKSGPRS